MYINIICLEISVYFPLYSFKRFIQFDVKISVYKDQMLLPLPVMVSLPIEPAMNYIPGRFKYPACSASFQRSTCAQTAFMSRGLVSILNSLKVFLHLINWKMYTGFSTTMKRSSHSVEKYLKDNQEEKGRLTDVLGFKQLNVESEGIAENLYAYKRPLWYLHPPQEDRPRSMILIHLFGRKRLRTPSFHNLLSNPITDNIDIDDFGFYKYNGKYKSIDIPDHIFDTHPHRS